MNGREAVAGVPASALFASPIFGHADEHEVASQPAHKGGHDHVPEEPHQPTVERAAAQIVSNTNHGTPTLFSRSHTSSAAPSPASCCPDQGGVGPHRWPRQGVDEQILPHACLPAGRLDHQPVEPLLIRSASSRNFGRSYSVSQAPPRRTCGRLSPSRITAGRPFRSK